MNSNFTIRVEEPRDFRTVETLTRESFWNVYHPGCTEHYVLRCFMEGNINFYRHAGFDLASKLHIHYHCEPKDSEVPYFLAQELIPDYLNGIEATYTPPKGYFVAEENPEDFAKYEAEFPYKEKLVLPGQLG